MLSEQYDTSGCTSLKCLVDISKRLHWCNTNPAKNWVNDDQMLVKIQHFGFLNRTDVLF
jgi:hypothetical protein